MNVPIRDYRLSKNKPAKGDDLPIDFIDFLRLFHAVIAQDLQAHGRVARNVAARTGRRLCGAGGGRCAGASGGGRRGGGGGRAGWGWPWVSCRNFGEMDICWARGHPGTECWFE